jgi:ADP-ribose pyrophosphatase
VSSDAEQGSGPAQPDDLAGRGDRADPADLADLTDLADPHPVRARLTVHHGRVWDVLADTVELSADRVVARDYIHHPGSVAILALDTQDRVALIRQYRHPVAAQLWELPAGLRDVDGETPHETAARELAEEADLAAEQWHVLADLWTSPGGSDEVLRIYLARGISVVPPERRFSRQDEEADLQVRWVDLDTVHAAVLAGRLHSPTVVVGVLTAHASRAGGWQTLRAADTPWAR